MADTEPKTPKTVEQFDVTSPIWVMLQQTPSKNFSTYFTGEGAEEKALAEAENLARTTKRPVVVFGPQVAAFGPPPPERASEIRLNF